jgi:rSAM/selenodomain-associated transferase 2
MLSIIIPTKNESKVILKTLLPLQKLRKNRTCEIILIDGNSSDPSIKIAKPYVDKILISQSDRSIQQNLGASVCKNNLLLFLHADTKINPKDVENIISQNKKITWGFFKIKFDNNKKKYRFLEFFINLRSMLFKYGTGDQCLFMNKDIFYKVGGFPNIRLMEDIEICSSLNKVCNPKIINNIVTSSSRKWESHGFIRTIIKMRIYRILYFLV